MRRGVNMFEKTKAILRKFDKATKTTLESEFEIEVIRKNNYTLFEFLELLMNRLIQLWLELKEYNTNDIQALEHDIRGLHII